MRSRAFTVLLFLITLPAAPVTPKDALEPILARMDKAANEFKTMTARVTNITHTDVINENSTETGTVVMQKVRPGEVQGLIDFISPDKRTIAFENRRLRIYYPKIKTVQEWNLGQARRTVRPVPDDRVRDFRHGACKGLCCEHTGYRSHQRLRRCSNIRLGLVPKTGEAREYVKQLELWIPETGPPYPVQEKISAPSGDYRLITYSDLKINTPLKPDALQLKLPAGVKTEYPGK